MYFLCFIKTERIYALRQLGTLVLTLKPKA